VVRKYGLAIDALVSVEIVTADGRILIASANENPDLFWAVRGGGGKLRRRDALPVPALSRFLDRARRRALPDADA
jgi:hypothetical protein